MKYNIQLMFVRRKNSMSLGLNVVGMYYVPCECGKVYVVQANGTVESRCKRHVSGTAR
jgi:hypothetical protein